MVYNKLLRHGIHFDSKNFFVTTSHKPDIGQISRAKSLSDELGVEFLQKPEAIVASRESDYGFYYVIEKERTIIRNNSEVFFFHPSSAKMRMRNLKHGQNEYLLDALKLRGNERILDLTLGLGSDAILMGAFLTTGFIIGVESSLHIYTIVRKGLLEYRDPSPWVEKSMKRIFPFHSDYKEYIRNVPDHCYDIIYCDPMFDHPVMSSSGLNPLRAFADYDSITPQDVKEMKRICSGAIVFKTLAYDHLFDKIEVNRVFGSKNSGIVYGVIA
jgi:hypothetical protein